MESVRLQQPQSFPSPQFQVLKSLKILFTTKKVTDLLITFRLLSVTFQKRANSGTFDRTSPNFSLTENLALSFYF